MKLPAVVVAFVLLAGLDIVAQEVPRPVALMTAKTATALNGGVEQNLYER